MTDKKLTPADYELLQRRLTETEDRNRNLISDNDKLRDKLRPYEQRAENDKRNAERDVMLINDLTRLEALITTHVKDPALRPAAFAHALGTSLMGGWGPWGMLR